MEIKELSLLCDRYQTLNKQRLFEEKVAKSTKKLEDAAKQLIMDTLRAMEIPTIGGTTHNFEHYTKDEPSVDDWDDLYGYIYIHKAWELLHRRLTATAVVERWDLGEEVPGVGRYPVDKLSVTKHK